MSQLNIQVFLWLILANPRCALAQVSEPQTKDPKLGVIPTADVSSTNSFGEPYSLDTDSSPYRTSGLGQIPVLRLDVRLKLPITLPIGCNGFDWFVINSSYWRVEQE